MKKKISILLLLSVLASMTACGGEAGGEDTSSSNETTASETTSAPTRLDELGKKDFGGKTFTILDANSSPHLRSNTPADEQNGDVVNDALYNRDVELEERYNVKIEYIPFTDQKGPTVFKNSVLAGDDEYQMIYDRIMSGFATITSDGVLANLADSEYLSLEREWWSPLMYDSVRLNGKMYFTTGDIVPSMYQLPSAMFYNTELAKDYGIKTDLVTMVREGKWTLDELTAMTKDVTRDVNNDGKMTADVDIFGLAHSTTNGSTAIRGWFTGAGIKLSEISADGKNIEVNLGTERVLEVLEKVRGLLNPEYTQENGQNFLTMAFAEDRALFAAHFVESASSFLRTSGMKSDYLIVPMPKYSVDQETYISAVNPWIEAFVGISSLTDLDFAGFMAEAMAFYSYDKIRPLAWDMTYGTKIARDDNTAEMLDIIFETSYVDFNMLYEFGASIKGALLGAVNGASLTTELAKVEGAIKGDIEKLVNSWG